MRIRHKPKMPTAHAGQLSAKKNPQTGAQTWRYTYLLHSTFTFMSIKTTMLQVKHKILLHFHYFIKRTYIS